MPDSDTGERVTDVLNLPCVMGSSSTPFASTTSRWVCAFTGTRPGVYVYVIDGSVIFGIDDREPVVLRAENRLRAAGRAPRRLAQRKRQVPASLLAFFVLDEGESPTVYTTVTDGVRARVRGDDVARRRGCVMRVVRLRAADGQNGSRSRRPTGHYRVRRRRSCVCRRRPYGPHAQAGAPTVHTRTRRCSGAGGGSYEPYPSPQRGHVTDLVAAAMNRWPPSHQQSAASQVHAHVRARLGRGSTVADGRCARPRSVPTPPMFHRDWQLPDSLSRV